MKNTKKARKKGETETFAQLQNDMEGESKDQERVRNREGGGKDLPQGQLNKIQSGEGRAEKFQTNTSQIPGISSIGESVGAGERTGELVYAKREAVLAS